MNYKLNHLLSVGICATICWLVPSFVSASVEVNGIYYDLNTSSKTAAVSSNPDKYSGVVDIPSSFVYNDNTYNVKSIGSCAFLSCSELTSVSFPSSVTTIGSSAFERCTGLTDLVIGSGVTTIDYEAFKNCSNLKCLTLPSSLKTIENETFSGCSSLAEIIAKGATPPTIVSTTFDGVDKTACMVYVPEGCQSTYARATNWKAFTNIVERTVLAYDGCGDNVTYTIYSDMTMVISGTGEMDMLLFADHPTYDDYCYSIKKVIIEEGVSGIGPYAFNECTAMISVSIPSSVNEIFSTPFTGSISLTTMTVASGNTTYDSRDNCNAIIETSTNTLIAGCKNSIIPNSVTSIGGGAFCSCTGLTSVTIPNSVTSIGKNAFNSCSGLTSVTVEGETPASVGNGAFYNVNKTNCILYVPTGSKTAYENAEGWSEFQNIEESPLLVGSLYYHLNIYDRTAIVVGIADKGYSGYLTIPESINYDGNTYYVVEIGNHAFSDCIGLTSVKIPNYLSKIDDYAFANCTGLTSVNLPNSLKFINEMAFYHCTGLTSLTIPNGVTHIAGHAFGACTGLTSLVIPSSVIEIGTCAFKACENLNSITVESEFPFDVYDGQFSEVDKETCVLYVPIGCKSAYERTFGWRDFENIVENTSGLEVLATGHCGNKVTYTIYSNLTMVISGNGSIWDSDSWFYISDSFEYYNEFYNETVHVLKIIIEDGVTGIGEDAILGSYSITSLTIPPSMTYIGKNAFGDCFNLTSVYISDLTALCNMTFEDGNPLSNAKHLYLNGVEIKDLVIPDNVSSVKSRVFYGCTGLTSLTIPNSVTSIGDWAFCCCTGLTSVVIPSSVTTIGEGAFSRCSELASISIPNSVTTIGGEAFSDTPWYDNQPDGLIYINHVAYKYKGEMPTGTKIAINSGTVSISGYAFSGCTGLTSIEIPSSVTSIGYAAFSYCSGLTSLVIPKSVTTIDDYAFYDCTKLTSIAVERETPPSVECYTFDCVNKTTCTLFVPFGSKVAYENADYWNEFENIVEVEFDTDISTLDNAIYVEQTEGRIGGTKDISVKMKNNFDVRGFQFTMELPEGTTVNSWTLSQDRMPAGTTMNKVFAIEGIDENKINVVCALNDGEKTFTGNDGVIATVNVSFADDMEEGTYPIYLTNASISDASSEYQLELSDIKATLVLEDYVLGDTNGDGKVLVGDVISILNYIVGSSSTNFNAKAADVNGDGKILVGDVIAVLNIIVNQ